MEPIDVWKDQAQMALDLSRKVGKKTGQVFGLFSEHFTFSELACRCCGRVYITPGLLYLLEDIREQIRRPVVINSGYRCPSHNAAIGGKPLSQHPLGTAADINIPRDLGAGRELLLGKIVQCVVKWQGGYKFYEEDSFVHVDVCPTPPNRRW